MASRPIYYDTETTGVRAETDRIIEIAAYDPVRKKSFESFVHPGIPIPPDATSVHGITDEMVADAPPFSLVGKQFAEFCSGEVILIAHNNDNFDLHFLRAEFKRHELLFPSWLFLDSLKWARRYRADLPRHALQFLREIYDVPANNAHRALDDVIVLKEVFEALIGDLTIDQVYELLNKPRLLQHMPFGKHQGKALAQLPKNYLKWLAGSGALEKQENRDLKESLKQLQLLG